MIPWFKKHPEFLRLESESLSKDGNYKQLVQVRNRLFLSHGQLLVRLDRIHRFPVLIVYTDATPFELPAFYILNKTLDETFVETLSHMTHYQLATAIKPHVRFYYELRHQNSAGALCVLEWDNLDDGTKYIGISTMLKRVREWCAGTITGVFPPDSQEIEFVAHFNDVDSELRLIYPESFLDTRLTCGEAFAQQYAYLPKIEDTAAELRTYMGCLLTGQNSAGITMPLPFNTPGLLQDEGIKSPEDLWTKPELLKKKLESKEWLRCFWFHVDAAPAPFRTADELIVLIGGGDKAAGLLTLHKTLYESLKLKPDHFFIALRFPDRKGELEFQLFKLYKNTSSQPTLFNVGPGEVMQAFMDAYTRVSAIECEKLTEETFHLRNSGRAEREKLKDKAVNIVGTGALGSEIADSLNKAGLGMLCLFDNQRLKAHNAVRHLSGFNYIGIPKVFAVANVLRQHNPFVHLEMFTYDINRIEIEELLSDGSVSVSSMADDNVEAYLNERAVLSGKTVFYARALRGAKAARIFRVIPGKDACFQCLNLYRQEKAEFIEVPLDETLPTLKNECNNPIRPASAADLKQIAAMASRLVIDHLQGGPSADNHWIWSTETLETTPALGAWQLHPQYLPPHPRCVYCHHDRHLRVFFSKTALAEMQALVSNDPSRETGGVLAGFVKEDGSLDVKFASGPGPNAVCTATKFEKDVPFCQNFLDELYKKKGAVYLGEWHSHPSENNMPSGTDLKSLSEIALQQDYLTDQPLMVILSNTGGPSFSIHPANKVYYHVEAEIG